MIHAPMFANPFAEPGELQNVGGVKPRMRRRFGIWCCVTIYPFVCGCGYDPHGAYEEWLRLLAEKVGPAEAS